MKSMQTGVRSPAGGPLLPAWPDTPLAPSAGPFGPGFDPPGTNDDGVATLTRPNIDVTRPTARDMSRNRNYSFI